MQPSNYRYSNEKGFCMKDQTDQGTGDMFGEKRGRGRPKTGTAKTGAERQAAFRAKKQDNSVTVTINRGLLEGLDAQMQAIRDGASVLVLTPEQAGEILKAIRKSSLKQLRGQRPRPQAKPTA
jgi:hypothetical protein